jgi:hypothetical protein
MGIRISEVKNIRALGRGKRLTHEQYEKIESILYHWVHECWVYSWTACEGIHEDAEKMGVPPFSVELRNDFGWFKFKHGGEK